MSASRRVRVEGHVSTGFDAVRDAFAENFSRRHELGGACCVYHAGQKVVDLWGGVRNRSTGEPWQEDTMVLYARNLEVPSGGGVGTARAIARAYSAFASGGRELQLSQGTLQALSAPAIPAMHGFYDECLMEEVRFSLGFMKPAPRGLWEASARLDRLEQAALLASLIRRPASATHTSPARWGRGS